MTVETEEWRKKESLKNQLLSSLHSRNKTFPALPITGMRKNETK